MSLWCLLPFLFLCWVLQAERWFSLSAPSYSPGFTADGESLAVFRNFFKWIPVYQLLAGIRQVLITSADMQFLLVISGLTLLVTGAASCVVLFHAKLK